MFDPSRIADGLARNRDVFRHLLAERDPAARAWRPAADKWSRLEIVCHLYDEEREDFRARVQHALVAPDEPAPRIDPQGWVTARQYAAQDYESVLAAFLRERDESVAWLRSLASAPWDRAYQHPQFGPLTARMFLASWLAHDLLHLRQLVRYDYQALQQESGEDLRYAGEW
jgi:hypothetical protein